MSILFPRTIICNGTRLLRPSLQAEATATAVRCAQRYYHHPRRNEDVLVITGATGTGKSKLSIDIASRFSGEVVNTDKIQVYRGLDITTNKIPIADRCGVPHHLLGELDPCGGELPPGGFRSLASSCLAGIAAHGRRAVLAGGSNSYIHALLAEHYDPRSDPFGSGSVRQERFRYRCCLLWVDVDAAVLGEHLDRRVDEMIGDGMVDELEEYFAGGGDRDHAGLGKAIGVPEFKKYFEKGKSAAAFETAVAEIKENTRRLAEAQVRKIKRLVERGWALRRLDASAAIAARLCGAGKDKEVEAWERDVVGPSIEAVRHFLDGVSAGAGAGDDDDGAHHQQFLLRHRPQPVSSVS
ncbi:putative transferase [Dioscorea sansibarensis]